MEYGPICALAISNRLVLLEIGLLEQSTFVADDE